MTQDHERRQCPECLRPWPGNDPLLKLAGFGWLNDLPRHVSPSNIDCWIHDGGAGRNRFLVLETKRLVEQWPMQPGQVRQLTSIAGLQNSTVLVVRGDSLDSLAVHRVAPGGVEATPTVTTASRLRGAVVAWLNGALWRDAEAHLGAAHLHAWQRRGSEFACALCGETWQEPLAAGNELF